MRTSDFGERVATLYEQTAGGTQLFVAGQTAVRQTVVIGSVRGAGSWPSLHAIHAPITDETIPTEQLRIATFCTDPDAREIRWRTVGSRTQALLQSNTHATRLVLPAGGGAVRYMVDGALLVPIPDMIPGMQPPQELPPNLEALCALLNQVIPAPTLRVAA